MLSSLLAIAPAILGLALGQSTFAPARVPNVPLAVRSPYLNTGLQIGTDERPSSNDPLQNPGTLNGQWAKFWQRGVTGWEGLISVDGDVYEFMGFASADVQVGAATQQSVSYTSTRSVFTMDVNGLVAVEIEFLSPVVPTDLKRMSLPVSYMNVKVSSKDGNSHDVVVYSDVTAEWATADRENAVVQWNFNQTGQISYHQFGRQTPLEWSELAIDNISDQTEFGNWYYATSVGDGVTWQSGRDADVRTQFINNQKLANTADTNYRPPNTDFPIFGLAVDLGSVTSDSSQSALFTINLIQDDPIQFKGANNETSAIPGLWNSYFDSGTDALDFFYTDFADVGQLCDTLDSQILADTTNYGGDNYAAFATLAVRQAFGGLQFANTTDNPLVFLKEISSDGNIQTADVIFPFFPIALYLNPDIIKYLLEPLFIQQEGGDWPYPYASHDAGAHYPNGTLDGYDPNAGNPPPGQEVQQVEESGNMIIMAVAYAKATNDTDYIVKHYDRMQLWANFLITDGQFPGLQLSTDDFQGRYANQTNLALKAISGLGAMGQAAAMIGKSDDAQNYTQTAQSFVTTVQNFGVSSDGGNHIKLGYNDDPAAGTYSTSYNAWPDVALGSNILPQSFLDDNSAFYGTKFDTYGCPLDSRDSAVKSDWSMWQAAISSPDVQKQYIDSIHAFLTDTDIAPPFSDLYDATNARFPDAVNAFFVARPVQGGLFAPLAMSQASAPVTGN